mmetsp:Transcript_11117/g.12230  ORF Transcript_11117/g.12230 Transcript_11117/m.12230 type:complete len:454 (+) Transcript_11117:2-1363(+)
MNQAISSDENDQFLHTPGSSEASDTMDGFSSPTQLTSGPLVRTKAEQPFVDIYSLEAAKILVLCSLPVFLFGIARPSYLPALSVVQTSLNATDTETALTLSIPNFAAGIAPFLWGPLSDRFGRKIILLIMLSIGFVASLLGSFAKFVAILIVARTTFLIAMSSSIIVAFGVISDVFEPSKQGKAVAILALTPLIGLLFGPIIGGALANSFGWEAIFYFLSAVSALFFIIVAVFFRETLQDGSSLRRSFNPLKSLRLLLVPPIPFVAIMVAILAGLFSFVPYSFSILFAEEPFNKNSEDIGVAMTPLGVGVLLGTFVGGFMADLGLKLRGRGGRIAYSLCGTVLVAIGFTCYGATMNAGNYGATLFVTFLLGFGFLSMYVGQYTFAISFSPDSPSSVTGAITALEAFARFGIVTLGPGLLDITSIYWLGIFGGATALWGVIPMFYVCFYYWNRV